MDAGDIIKLKQQQCATSSVKCRGPTGPTAPQGLFTFTGPNGTVITSFTIGVTAGSNTATDPNIFQYNLPTPVSTLTLRGLQIILTATGTNSSTMNIYTVVFGFL